MNAIKRRRFLQLALTLPLASGAVFLSGCGGGKSRASLGSAGGSLPVAQNRGGAEGYAFLSASGELLLFNTAAEGAAAGLAPASGLRAEIVGTGPSTTIGSDGLLQMRDISAGLRVLRISSINGSSGSSGSSSQNGGGAAVLPFELPLTVVPGAVLPLGTTAVSRAAAVDAVRSQVGADLLASADVLASSTPLPAGVLVGRAIASEDAPVRIAQTSWFVYIDTSPSARFGHDTVLAIVDAQTGEVTLQASDSWPLLNGATYYGLASVNQSSPDAVQVASRARRPSAPVLSEASANQSAPVSPSAASGACRAADIDGARTHYLIVQGDQRADFGFDPPRIQEFLSAAPFPATGQAISLKTFDETVEPRVAIVNAFNTVRDAAKSGDTLVVYITTHGIINEGNRSLPPEARYKMSCERGRGVPSTGTLADGTTYNTSRVDIRDLDFGPCKACRIILLIDTCYSGNWIPILRPQLDALEKPRDILLFTAADQLHQAVGLIDAKPVDLGAESGTVDAGGLFTQSLLVSASRQKNILVKGAVSTDLLASSFDTAKALTDADNQKEIAAKMLLYAQNPQRYVRPLDPDDVCGKGDQNVIVQ